MATDAQGTKIMITNLTSNRTLVLSAFTGLLTLLSTNAYADYASAVLSDSPKAYYRFNDTTARTALRKNYGTIGSAGDATDDLGVVQSIPGAIVGTGDRAAFFDFASRSEVPWNAAFNPPNTQSFSVEVWFYPTSDQTATGQAPLNNRFAPSGSGINRQGWVFFQRKPSSDYLGGEQVGWNFRMYNENGGSAGLDITSLAPYELGKWTHVVVVYDAANVVDASLTMYIDGVEANTVAWTGTGPGYVANSNDHPTAAAELALGNYNNTAGTSLNPYFGGIDEFAFYSNKLSADQVLSHYQNATNSHRTVSYDSLVKSANPVLYMHLNELPVGPDIAVNMGDLRANGTATHTAEVRHPAASALAGRTDDGAAGYHNRNGNSTTTIPYKVENNPDSGVPFTFETWLRPLRDQQGGQCPVNNRFVKGTGRTGWVIFQRNPNLSYPPSEGHGYNFRMYSGNGSSGQDVLTDVDYNIGEWSHLVVTWEPQTDNGDPAGNGNHQFQGTLTAYFNGELAASNPNALYAANRADTETGDTAGDLAIGSYNAASGIGSNPFEGEVDEFAFYNNYVLTPDQILEHYQAGTNAFAGTNYETLVLTAAFSGPERLGPKTYLRFNEPAFHPATNSGTLGYLADGNILLSSNTAPGPRPPVAGFDASNTALPLDGTKQWASFNNPDGLNFTGQITLEAWVQPGDTQGDTARIISHGPPTLSDFLSTPPDNSFTTGSEVFLRIDNAGANYTVGSATFTNEVGISNYVASAPIPAGDLGGGKWIHLAGVYTGTNWVLYRNGVELATSAAPSGALKVEKGDWAVGSTGNGWADSFNGAIDEVAIYDHALTLSQIQAHFAGGVATAALHIISISTLGGNVTIAWENGTGPFTVQRKASLTDANWADVTTTSDHSAVVPNQGASAFFRIVGK
ncbi:MAG: putative Immunoglobulin I-set domain protein [Verrucomicrobiales bacterium]|nr:putative Immunoglobulin I-set domain protein [Verrucomicrobiales bacterium]